MQEKQILYVAGAVMPHDKIRKNIASSHAGFLGSKIYTDQEQQLLDSGVVKKIPIYDRVLGRKDKHIVEIEKETDYYRAHHAKKAEQREGRPRLVQGRKSPTGRYYIDNFDFYRRYFVSKPVCQHVQTILASHEAHDNFDSIYASCERNKAGIYRSLEERTYKIEPIISPVSLQLQKKDWSGQYRAQVVTQIPSSSPPPPIEGERYTDSLKARAVSKIFESGAYVSTCHEGFTTFITLTFDQEQRKKLFGGYKESFSEFENYYEEFFLKDDFLCELKNYKAFTPLEYERNMGGVVRDIAGPYTTLPIRKRMPKLMNASGAIAGDFCLLSQKPETEFKRTKTNETTIGKEVGRFLDGCKKMYHRGWKAGDEKVDGHNTKPSEFGPTRDKADFHSIWVAECPPNQDGEPNPHVHILLKWTVEPHLFKAWAKRLEGIWGHGMAHIERIREPKAASSYLIKALGYATKGENADQGLIRGNRYNIAQCSRAPEWETLASFEVGNITAVIKELGYKLEQWKRPIERQIAKMHYKKSILKKDHNIAKKSGKPEEYTNKLYQKIIRLEKSAIKAKETMKSRGVHASTKNRFSVSFDGEEAEKKLDDFLMWAAGARGWSMECKDIDLSDLKEWADENYHHEFIRFQDKRAYWKAVIEAGPLREEPDEDEVLYWRNIQYEYTEGRACA
ncbi:hypothetical protein L3V77_24155 [Vibrio sp. DW001]|uniref:hypothetical protein n=1 Tax=Vibrio sp. DW001 TaxID=2912315 RepID=UPI0023B19795|nr:hypothetical protein [Vibrio sp. DW001]WED29029.1 hypothetical protein L3V77_24155 [Vibrio sp. DW001]